MPGIFDQILDHYEISDSEWRLFLYDVIEKITRRSVLKKSLPSYVKEEDFLGETFLVMDEIARSGLPRKDKITKLFACSRFTNVPQKSKLGITKRVSYNLDTYDNDWEVCELALVDNPPELNQTYIALETSWEFSEEELQIVKLLEEWNSFREVARLIWISPSYGRTICNEIREKIKRFKDNWLLEDDYHSNS